MVAAAVVVVRVYGIEINPSKIKVCGYSDRSTVFLSGAPSLVFSLSRELETCTFPRQLLALGGLSSNLETDNKSLIAWC